MCVCACVWCGGGGVHTERRRYEVFVILRDGLMVQHKMLQQWGEGGGWREEEEGEGDEEEDEEEVEGDEEEEDEEEVEGDEEEGEEGVGSLLHL